MSKIKVSFSGALLPKQKEKCTLIFDRCSIVLSSISSCAKKYNEKNSIRETGVYGNLEGKVFLFHSCLPFVSFLCTRGNRRKNNAASVKNQGVLFEVGFCYRNRAWAPRAVRMSDVKPGPFEGPERLTSVLGPLRGQNV